MTSVNFFPHCRFIDCPFKAFIRVKLKIYNNNITVNIAQEKVKKKTCKSFTAIFFSYKLQKV